MNLTKKLIFGLLLAGALFTTACGDGDGGHKVGDDCTQASDCGDALTCNTTSKKCEEKPANGGTLDNDQACDAHNKCKSGFCDISGTDKCKDAPGKATVDDGGTCSDKEQCKTANATCDANKCKAPASTPPAAGEQGGACSSTVKCKDVPGQTAVCVKIGTDKGICSIVCTDSNASTVCPALAHTCTDGKNLEGDADTKYCGH